VVIAEDLLEHLALAALGARDPLAHLPVELAKVVLDLAEVGEERPGRVRGLHEALANLRRLEKLEAARADALDLGVEQRPAALELRDPRLRVGLRAFGDLTQQIEDHLEPRLRADEGPLLEP